MLLDTPADTDERWGSGGGSHLTSGSGAGSSSSESKACDSFLFPEIISAPIVSIGLKIQHWRKNTEQPAVRGCFTLCRLWVRSLGWVELIPAFNADTNRSVTSVYVL